MKAESPIPGAAVTADGPAIPVADPNLDAARWFAHHFGVPFSEVAVASRLEGTAGLSGGKLLGAVLHAIGLKSRLVGTRLKSLDPVVLPCVAFDGDGKPLIITGLDRKATRVSWIDPQHPETEHSERLRKVQRGLSRDLLLVTLADAGRRSDVAPGQVRASGHWFWKPVRENWVSWLQIMLASLLINVLGLALPLFIMNVYDKVVPNLAFVTLWTLALGVALAVVFDLVLRTVRSSALVAISRRVDLKVGAALFRQALDLGLLDRSGGAAAMAGRIREYESVREFFTSATFISFFDLIFIGVFLAVLYVIVGPLALVPAVAVPMVLLLAIVTRDSINAVAETAVHLAARRQTVLMEALHGIETVKTLNAEPVMQREWENTIAATARSAGRAQFWSNLAVNGTIFVQQAVSVIVIVWGTFLIFENRISVGALIAASILSGRAMAPLSMIAQAVYRLQYVVKSLKALDRMMDLPTENPGQVRSDLRVTRGRLEIADLTFTYPEARVSAIRDVSLEVQPGEVVALLGRVGSGKTTLGRLICGLLEPERGTILIDGHSIDQFDRAELREGVGFLPQNAGVFTGSLRENLLLGNASATPDDIERALHFSGLDRFVSAHPSGLSLMMSGNGSPLSGGQVQALALARLLIRRPRLLFLDEPTNAMDQEMERTVFARLRDINAEGVGIIVSTHKQTVADVAERFVILDAGRKVLDGSKDEVMRRLAANEQERGAET